MKKFKDLISIIAEATKTGVARYQAAFRDQRPVEDPFSQVGAFGSRQTSTYGAVTAKEAGLELAQKRRVQVQAAAKAEGQATGEAKVKQAAELAARIATTTQQATTGSGVMKQIDALRSGQTIGVDLVDGGSGYVHHHENGTKYFSKGHNKPAHPIHKVQIHPDHLKITTPRKSGRNVTFPVVATIHHGDATPVKSGSIDRMGRFVTTDDINR